MGAQKKPTQHNGESMPFFHFERKATIAAIPIQYDEGQYCPDRNGKRCRQINITTQSSRSADKEHGQVDFQKMGERLVL